ncbi:hypothetical protein [Adlercreutzia caecimuris]|uniref:hypothetical protein n=1 Tax=Adlercreutzia caecimuris TaxID=671266 RepID=UPI00259033C9|nr:hypothetical protein [Adlercreutzia caecimuris]
MSDCSAKEGEQHRTCGACEELYMAPRCNRFGHVMLDENDEPDDDGTTFADCCSLWTPRTEPTLEQRCQQLGQVARDMYDWADGVVNRHYTVVPGRVDGFRARLEALGVSVDG